MHAKQTWKQNIRKSKDDYSPEMFLGAIVVVALLFALGNIILGLD
jgi:hypothetical protein